MFDDDPTLMVNPPVSQVITLRNTGLTRHNGVMNNYNSPCTSVLLYYFLEGYVRRGVRLTGDDLTPLGFGQVGGGVPFTVTCPEVPLSRVAESSSDAGRGDPCW